MYSLEETNTKLATQINFTQCINILKSNPQYKDSNLVAVQFEVERTEPYQPKQNEYAIYDMNTNEKVNLSLCNDIKVEVSYPLQQSNPNINMSMVNSMCDQGIDIFNPDSPFFNDICFPFASVFGTDIPLKDRRSTIFQNVSLCDSGCKYKSYDCETGKVSCDCSIKEEVSLAEDTDVPTPIYEQLLDSTNIIIVKCYKLLLDINNYQENIGFWLIMSLIVLSILCLVLYYKTSKNHLYSKIVQASPNIKNENSNFHKNPFDLDTIPSSERSIKSQSNKTLIANSTVNNILTDSLFEIDEKKEDINDLPYTKALRVDHRNLFKMNLDIIFTKIELIQIIFFSGAFDLITLNLSVYILSFGLDFTLNALLFSDDVISKTHKNQGKSDYTVTFMLSMLSNLIGNVLSSLFIRLTTFNFAYEEISQEIKNKEDFLSNCTKIIHDINRKIVLHTRNNITSILYIL